ncbi:MAG: diguanylate cyclase, partial [Spirochaetia bacterium]
RKPSFELRIPAGEKKEYLIMLFDYQSSSLVLTMEEIGRYSRRYSRETFILGLIFGFFLLLIIYNLFVFIFNREKTYLYYALYMAAFFLNQFSQERLLLQFILSDQSFGYFWFVLFGGSTLFFGIQFFRHFIETKKKMPKLDKVMTGGVILSGILVGSSLFFHGPFSADILNILSLGSMGLIFAALIMRIIRKDILALVCFIGSLLYLIGTSVEILMTFLPLQITSFVLNAQLYGAAAQVVFIAFAVGAKSFKLRKRYNEMQKHFRKDLETRVGERTRELEEANKKLALYAITDSLTGLYNRSELNSRIVELDNLIARRSGTEKPYEIAAAYMDLDNFKRCNDTLGHRSGDRLLIMVAEILKQNTRGYDMIFRIGGDEFLIIMPETGLKESYRIVERIRSKIEEDFRKDTEVPISVSIGLAATQQLTDPDMESLIHQADIALLRSKDQGKNTVFFAS